MFFEAGIGDLTCGKLAYSRTIQICARPCLFTILHHQNTVKYHPDNCKATICFLPFILLGDVRLFIPPHKFRQFQEMVNDFL